MDKHNIPAMRGTSIAKARAALIFPSGDREPATGRAYLTVQEYVDPPLVLGYLGKTASPHTV
jgi:hypothetical protein